VLVLVKVNEPPELLLTLLPEPVKVVDALALPRSMLTLPDTVAPVSVVVPVSHDPHIPPPEQLMVLPEPVRVMTQGRVELILFVHITWPEAVAPEIN
jgi:hypothetical protein